MSRKQGSHDMNDQDKVALAAKRKAQQVGLFRYQVICPALDPGLSKTERGRAVRQIAAATHQHPISGVVSYSRESIDRWIRAYRAGGFDALVPVAARPSLRTEPEILELAAGLKRENPGRTAAQVARLENFHAGRGSEINRQRLLFCYI